jgi:hypothetical protein
LAEIDKGVQRFGWISVLHDLTWYGHAVPGKDHAATNSGADE